MSGNDDPLCVALLFCATFGVGSMSFGVVFAAAGPQLAATGLYFLSACNLHASVVMSKALMVAPVTVRTFSDLSYYAFGDLGRRIVLLAEWGAGFLSPIAFLILGGTNLLPCLFQGSVLEHWSPTHWIIAMSLCALPLTMVPTLKLAPPLAALCGLAAVLADAICIGYSLQTIHLPPRETQIQPANAMQTFGLLLFATGTASRIPSMQQQHSDPARFANQVSRTLLFITLMSMVIGIAAYSQFGCMAPATLLDQLPTTSSARKVASTLMLAHLLMAFSLLQTSTLHDMEQSISGKDEEMQQVQKLHFTNSTVTSKSSQTLLLSPIVNDAIPIEKDLFDSHDTLYVNMASPPSSNNGNHSATSGAFRASDVLNRGLLRTLTVGLQAFLAILFQASYLDVLSFIGATAISVSCMIMPCLCYLRIHPIATQTFRGKCDLMVCHLTIASSTVLGIYCACIAIGNLSRDMRLLVLSQATGTATLADAFPYCYEGERN